jgi:hypothetical protein
MATKNIVILQYGSEAPHDMVEEVVSRMTQDLQIPVVAVIGAQAMMIPVSVDVHDELMRRILGDA